MFLEDVMLHNADVNRSSTFDRCDMTSKTIVSVVSVYCYGYLI